MAILMLFEHFSDKLCSNFLTLILSTSITKYDAFCSHIFNYACLRLIVIEEVRNYGKIVFIKIIVEKAVEVNTYPSSPLLDPPLTISYESHQKSLAYFSHLAPFILFTKRQSQMGGRGHGTVLPLNALLGRCHWSVTKLKQWWRAYCVFAYHQHDEQK